MKIVVGIDDYRECVSRIPPKGKWRAWFEDYYSRHKEVFDLIFKYLYMADVEAMRMLVEACDFHNSLEIAERFLACGGIEKLKQILPTCEDFLDYHGDYRLFVLVGIGQVGGTAPPSPHPLMYLGAECIGCDMRKLELLLSHEFHHLVRFQALTSEAVDMAGYTFGELIVTEGMATAFSIVVQGLGFDAPALKSALFMNDEALSYCTSNRNALIQEILDHRNSSVTQDLMAKYLYAGNQMDTGGMPGNVGYYVGTAIVSDLLAQGMDLRQLTNMSGNEVINLWEKLKSPG